jgi:threonine dehydrogenase-like Zn-dependent dehydrogenase
MACIIAKIFGARRVTLLEVDAHRINFAVKHGFADDGINPETESSLIYRVIRNTGGAYADVVFDALPGAGLFEDPDTRSLAAELLRPDGAWVMYGAAKKMMMPTMTFLAKGIHISGAPYDSRLISFRRRAQTMALAHSLIRSGDIPVDLFISRSIDFFDEKAVIQAVLGYGRGPEIKIEIQGR